MLLLLLDRRIWYILIVCCFSSIIFILEKGNKEYRENRNKQKKNKLAQINSSIPLDSTKKENDIDR